MLIKGCFCIEVCSKLMLAFVRGFMYVRTCVWYRLARGKHKARPTLLGTCLADHYSSFILKSAFAKIFQGVCHELLPNQYLMYFICIVYVCMSICLNKLKNSSMYLGIYTQHMFKKLGRYKYTYCVNTLIHVYVCVLVFIEIFGGLCVSAYFASSVQM